MSSNSLHLIDTNQSECEGVKNWFEVWQFNLIDTNQSECEGVKNWYEVCQFNRDNGSNYRVVMLYDTRGPLIEFESSDYRGTNNQNLN